MAHLVTFVGLVVLVYSYRSGTKLVVGQWNWGLRDHLVPFDDIVAALAHEGHYHGCLPRGVSDDSQLRDPLELVMLCRHRGSVRSVAAVSYKSSGLITCGT